MMETPKEIYDKFKKKKGSNHIASEQSIAKIIEICKKEDVDSVLELGTGIGTVTYAMIQEGVYIDTYESNRFCMSKSIENLKGKYRLTRSYWILPINRSYDLIVVDGGTGKGNDEDDGEMKTISLFLQSLDSFRYIFVDGKRTGQRAFIRKALRDRHTYKVTKYDFGTFYEVKKSNSKLLKWYCYFRNRV